MSLQRRTLLVVLGLFVSAVAVVSAIFWGNFSPIRWIAGFVNPNITTLPTENSSVLFLTSSPSVSVSVYAKGLQTPRVIAFDPRNRMLVSEQDAGRVTRIDDTDNDGTADATATVIDGLSNPHGLAFYTDPVKKYTYLYIAETHQVMRYLYDVPSGTLASKTGRNIMTFPKIAGQHVTRTVGFFNNLRIGQLVEGVQPTQIPGAESKIKLYASVGSTCDACIEYSWKSGAMLESNPEGDYTAEFAGGLRNSVFFAVHPITGQMWATEMGRDDLGDNLPPDEINIITENGKYGWPFCYGDQVRDKVFMPEKVDRTDIPQDCSKTKSPVIEIPAHSAPLGLGFVPSGKGWPSEWAGDLLVAYHGSENSTIKKEYKIVRYDLDKNGNVVRDANGAPKVYDFITGWHDGTKTYGRPVDVKFASDGTLYITDDAAGFVYRVTYRQ